MRDLAWQITHNKEDAEDLAEEALLAYYQKQMATYIRNPDAYLKAVLERQIGNYLTKKKRRGQILKVVPLEEIEDSVSAPPERSSISELFTKKTSPADKKILVMRGDLQMPYDEIAERLKIKEPSCRSKFSRAIHNLAVDLGLEKNNDPGATFSAHEETKEVEGGVTDV